MRHPLSFEAFRDFCAQRPPDEEYDWYFFDECAVAQYANSIGLNYEDCKCLDYSGGPAGQEPYTFGALAERLEAKLMADKEAQEPV